jgi:hypothetical protein
LRELFQHNLRYLDRINPKGADCIRESRAGELKVIPVITGTGAVTFRVEKGGRTIFLHSRYDPAAEAWRFILDKGVKEGDRTLVYGFGLGYHIRELLKLVGKAGRVDVIEPNTELFREVMQHIDLSGFLTDNRLNLVLDNDFGRVAGKAAGLLAELQGRLLIHRPSLELTPDYARPLKQALLEWQVKQDTVVRYAGLLDENLRQNRELIKKLPGVTRFLRGFDGVPAMLVAAGPSLDKGIGHIRDLQHRCLVVAVGTALKPLLASGVEPDLVVITDPHPMVEKQISGVSTKAPLAAFPTVHPGILAGYPGPVIIACQRGMDGTEKIAAETGEELIDTGGSVATAALDITLRMGCSPILFAGLDLGYVQGKTHAAGTMHEGLVINDDQHLQEIPDNRKSTLKAPLNLTIYRKWIEGRIEKAGPGPKFFNLSAEGALIKGAHYITWAEVAGLLHTDWRAEKQKLYEICSA